MSFSIDDVRDTFTRDISGLIGSIRDLSAPLQAELAPRTASESAFARLGDGFHTVYGTTMLVGAKSLAETSSLLEALCKKAEQTLVAARQQQDKARRIAGLCAETAEALAGMLELELDHRSGEASAKADSFRAQRIDSVCRAIETPVAATAPRVGETPSEFAFDDASAPDAAQASPASPSHELAHPSRVLFSFVEEPELGQESELLAIFQEESRELLVLLRGHLDTLLLSPRDLGAIAQMERTFHTLKGSAATVGAKEVSKVASELQLRLQQVLESGAPVDAVFIEHLRAALNDLLVRAGLQAIVGANAVNGPSLALDPSALFLEEAREICRRAQHIVIEAAGAAPERLRELRGELARSFHRLKGSALLSTDPGVAREAERLQRRVEANEPLGLELSAGLSRIATTLGFSLQPSTELVVMSESEKLVREPVKLTAEPELLATVIQECAELLDAIDRIALDLEASDQPKLALNELFRLYHTLKGAVNTVGLTPTGQELHLVEDFLETLRDATMLPAMRGVATLLLEVQSDLRRQLRQAGQGFVEISLPRVRAAIAAISSGGELDSRRTATRSQERSAASGTSASAGQPESALHDATSRKYIRVGTERLDTLMNLAGELVVSRSRLMSRVVLLRGLQQGLSASSRRLVETVDRFRDDHEFSRVAEHGAAQPVAQLAQRSALLRLADTMQAAAPWSSFSELELDRYDDVNVLARSLTEITSDVSDINLELVRELAGFADDSDAFSSLVSGIQTEVTRARMIELEFLFTRVRLPARDAAQREVKEIRVLTRGEEVSLDKTIADALFGPMLHLVRNAVVHGIESPAARRAAGKPALGVITLGAREEAGQVVIEVEDDGAGLDLRALRERGVAMGLVSPETPLSDPAIRDLVFAPGLSTRASAGDVSGRGIGGDVIRRAIERMNGSIHVESEPGRGTTFKLSLPVTLSITRALLIRHRGRTLAVPLHFSERIIDAQEVAIVNAGGERRVRLDDTYLPVRTLDEVFKTGNGEAPSGPLLILRLGRQRICLQVEKVSSQEEIVVKSMGDLLTGHPLFAGATIRGNGELVLILDVPALIEGRQSEARTGDAPLPALPQLEDSFESSHEVSAARAAVRAPAVAQAPLANAAPRPARLRVLFVDDSLSVRRVAEKALQSLGAEVTLAVDGVDALAKLQDASFDIVFTDLEMPRTHGYDLIRELRFIPAHKDLPIVVVSSRSGKKHQDQARALGASEYMTKPFSAKGLEAALERWCSGRRDPRSFHESPESL